MYKPAAGWSAFFLGLPGTPTEDLLLVKVMACLVRQRRVVVYVNGWQAPALRAPAGAVKLLFDGSRLCVFCTGMHSTLMTQSPVAWTDTGVLFPAGTCEPVYLGGSWWIRN